MESRCKILRRNYQQREMVMIMTLEQQIDYNIPSNQIPKSIAKKSDYNYIRNNEVEWECKKKERDYVKMRHIR